MSTIAMPVIKVDCIVFIKLPKIGVTHQKLDFKYYLLVYLYTGYDPHISHTHCFTAEYAQFSLVY